MALGVYPPATANVVVDPSPTNCCLTAVSDCVGIDTVVEVNGDRVAVEPTPLLVMTALYEEMSLGVIAVQVNSVVFVIAESGLVGTVKLPV
jgi:hypothetical protein